MIHYDKMLYCLVNVVIMPSHERRQDVLHAIVLLFVCYTCASWRMKKIVVST